MAALKIAAPTASSPRSAPHDDAMRAARALKFSGNDLYEFEGYADTYDRWLRRLRKATAKNDAHGIKKICEIVTDCFAAKVCAVARVTPVPATTPPTLGDIKQQANALSLYSHIDETVGIEFQLKSQSTFRFISKFGPKRRAAQRLCADLLEIIYPLQSFDFLARRRGVDRAVGHLANLIEKENAQYVVAVDISNCFGSPNNEEIGKHLLLPTRVVNHCLLLGDKVKLVAEPIYGVELPTSFTLPYLKANGPARRGLPQGSSASQLIMNRAILGPRLRSLLFADHLVQFGDDFAAPAKDVATTEVMLETLTSVLSTTPVGPFAIGRHSIAPLSEGFNFLGYRISRKAKCFGGHLHYRPSKWSFSKMEAKAIEYYEANGKGEEGSKRVASYLPRWTASFPRWPFNEWSNEHLRSTMRSLGIALPPLEEEPYSFEEQPYPLEEEPY